MESKGLFTNNYHNYDTTRGMFGGHVNPFAGYSVTNKFSTPYQFPAVSDANIFSLGGGTLEQSFPQLHDSAHGFGLKFGGGGGAAAGGGTGYGHSSVGQQSHYGPPMMMGGKGGKLKGAALSALTLLAFLFFLNLLQSCLKDQMEAVNPTVMVMSAGQRAVVARNEENEAKKRLDQNYENIRSDELTEYADDEDYSVGIDDGAMTATMTKNHKRIRGKQQQQQYQQKRHKSKATIGPKLQNLQLIRSTV